MTGNSSINHELDPFFYPRGVALIGVSDNIRRGGYFILRNTLLGYKGPVYPVNPKYQEVQGQTCYPDIESIPENFDLAIYFIPAKFLPETIRACAKKKAKAIIIESAGFSETGPEGKNLQDTSVALAKESGIRLWGPNCMGLLDGHTRHVFSFMSQDWTTAMQPGPISLIVQSGMLSSGFLMMMLQRGNMGMSKVASLGNKCDVHESELLEYYIDDPNTGVIGCYLESIVDGRRFMECARKTAKPVVVLKAGRSPQGARAAMSHTASLSGKDAVYTGAFNQAGIIQVYDIHELMDFVRGFSMTPHCSCKGGTAVITFSGGAGIVTVDLLAEKGLKMAELSPETLSVLKEVFPQWMDPAHPLDLWPAAEQNGIKRVYTHCVEAVLADPGVDSLVLEAIASPRAGNNPDYLKDIAEMKKKHNKPIVLWMVSTGTDETYKLFRTVAESVNIPEFTEINRAASFIAAMKAHFTKKRRMGLIS